MDYSKTWSIQTPGYIIFLIDQSGSMKGLYAGIETKADFTANVVNSTIHGLIDKCSTGKAAKDKLAISLIGYGGRGGDSVEEILPHLFLLDDFNQNANEKEIDVYAGAGRTTKEFVMEWVKPVFNGLTPMAEALRCAKSKIETWMSEVPKNSTENRARTHPVPVIINISDGLPYDSRDNEELSKNDAIDVAKEIMALQYSDGNPLIFNAHIDNIECGQCTCPISKEGLDKQAEFLFEISSKIPTKYYNNYVEGKKADELATLPIQPNSKAFVSNALPVTFIKFIEFGSSGVKSDLKKQNNVNND